MFSRFFCISLAASVCIVILFMLCARSCQYQDSAGKQAYSVKTSSELLNNLLSSFQSGLLFQISYPRYYVASFLDDKERLVVLTTDDTSAIREDITQRCRGIGFLVCPCENNRNKLQLLISKLKSFESDFYKCPMLKNMRYMGCSLTGSGRQVSIILSDDSDSNIDKFRRFIMDSPLFVFKRSAFDLERSK
ncbi:hypothetical protein [Bacteroides sp.]